MANFYGLDSGSNALSHSLISSGDEFQQNIPALKQRRRYRHRKSSSKARALDVRRRIAASNSGESADELGGEGDDNGAMGDSEESDDAEGNGFAPSDAVKRGSRMELKSKRRSLNDRTRQAGLNSSMAGSSKFKKPRSILSHSRARSTEKVRFNLENLTSFADDLSGAADSGVNFEDIDLSSGGDDEVYETLNFISESDEDDDRIEELESEILIKHLEETGEINEIGQILPWTDTFLEEIDRTEDQNREKAPLTAENFGVDFFSQSEGPQNQMFLQDPVDIVSSIELAPLAFPSLQDSAISASDFETGLQTPSSISLAPKKFDDEETEEEEPSHRRVVNAARLSRTLSQGVSRGPSRVRKNSKPKTPKRGSWNIPKGTTIIRHDDDDKIVMTQFGKLTESGTLTPRGLIKRESFPSTPILGIPMAPDFLNALTAPSSAQTSPLVGPSESVFFSDAANQFTSPPARASSLSLQDFVKDDHDDLIPFGG